MRSVCAGPWSNGKMPPWRGGEPGSIPGGSIEEHGRQPDTVGRAAVLTRFSQQLGDWGSNLQPSAGVRRDRSPDGETEITPRFYRGIPGSNPGRGAGGGGCDPVREALLEECGNGGSSRWVTGPGWKPVGGNPLWVRLPHPPLPVRGRGNVCVCPGGRGVVVCTSGCEPAGDGSIPFDHPLT